MKSLLEDWRNLLGHQKQVGPSTLPTLLYLSDVCYYKLKSPLLQCISLLFLGVQAAG